VESLSITALQAKAFHALAKEIFNLPQEYMEVSKTDRQTDKTTRWAFTAYKDQWTLFDSIPDLVSSWGWQTEVCPDTQREHYQGYILLKRQARFTQLKQLLPGVHIEAARDWNKLLQYCKKTDTAIAGSQVVQTNASKHLTMTEALLKLAAHVPFRGLTKSDHEVIKDYDKFYKQESELIYNQAVMSILEEDDRLVSVYANNAMKFAWNSTREYYLEKARREAEWAETDRQTDIPSGVPAFEN